MTRLARLISCIGWRGAVAFLLVWLAGPAHAVGGCSPYMGQVVINEVRVGSSNSTNLTNQVELYNVGGVPASVWQTWSVQIWFKDGTKVPVRKGNYALSTGHTSSGAFIWNNVTKYWLQNRNAKGVDIAYYDANGDMVAYFAIEAQSQTVPACYGSTTLVQSSSSGDDNGSIRRTTDNGTWPASFTKTSVHTIGRTNVCTAAGGDLVISNDVNYARPVRGSTLVTFLVTAYNNACSTSVSGTRVLVTNVNTTNFASLTLSPSNPSGGSVSASGLNQDWNIGTMAAGATKTLTIRGIPNNLGTVTVVASVSAPTSGLFNTADDSDTAVITAYANNFVGFEFAAESATEGIDTSFLADLHLNAPASADTTVNYAVSGSAGSGDTNLAASGSVTIAAGATAGSIAFTITNDAFYEPTKTIVLTITSVSSADPLVLIGSAATNDILTDTITLYDDDPPLDHYQIVASSTALACMASTVTITACADASNPCSNASTGVTGTTATLAASAGTLGATTLTFNASGVATTTLSHPAAANGVAATVTLSGESTPASAARKCCPDGVSCISASSCTVTFNTAGFIISASAGSSAATLPTQTAGTSSGTYQLRAVQTNTTTKACEAGLVGANTVNWAYQCIDPSTCSASNLMTLTGSSAALIARNPASAVTSYTSVPMTFDANGNAPFSFALADVGQIQLWVSKVVAGATLAGSSNAFVTRPGGFTVTNIRQTAAPNLVNPAAADAAGAKFIKAGEAFSATVSAVTSGGAVTPNYGRESSPEGVLLTPTLVLPVGGNPGTLANATLAGSSFTTGSAGPTNLTFSEVGIVTLTPAVADGSYLGTGNLTGTTTGNIGRFVPAMFAVTGASVTHRVSQACAPASAFTYLGENFRLGFTLSALNVAGATTQNYSGSFAKLDLTLASGWNLNGIDGSTRFSTSNGRLSLGTATGAWSSGAGAVTITANAARAATPDGPFNAAFGIAPLDSDGVAIGSYNLASIPSGSLDRASLGSLALRFGRLRLSSAIGAQNRALAMPLAAHYWNGSAFGTNALDSCTTIAPAAFSLGNLRKTLTAADAVVSGSSIRLASGAALVTLSAPAGGRFGTADVAMSLGSSATDASCLQTWTPARTATSGASLAYLRGGWCGGTQDKDPAARATFGLYGGNDAMLYQRENY